MIINGPNLDIHQKGNGWTDTSEPCAVSGNEINLYVLYMKTGYSSRIYFHQRPSRQPYCCQTKLFSQSPTFWKNYLTSHHYFFISFYHTQSIYYLPHTGFIPPALIHPSVHFPRKKSKSLDLANKRLHNLAFAFPPTSPLLTLLLDTQNFSWSAHLPQDLCPSFPLVLEPQLLPANPLHRS